MKHTLLYLILVWIARFFVGFVVGSFAGIGAHLAALAVTAVLLALTARGTQRQAGRGLPDTRSLILSTLSFSGVLLVCLPLRFSVECLLPDLSRRAGLYARFGDAHFVLYLCAFLLSAAVSVLVSDHVAYAAREYPMGVRFAACGAATAAFSLSLPAIASDFVFGMFLTLFLIRRHSYAVAGVYAALYQAAFGLLDYLEYRGGATYGAMMGGLQTAGMLALFAGFGVAFSFVEARFTSARRPSPIIAVVCILASALLCIIGVAVIQSSNL